MWPTSHRGPSGTGLLQPPTLCWEPMPCWPAEPRRVVRTRTGAARPAMAGEEGSAEMALAKSLADRIDEGDAARSWAKVGAQVARAVRDLDFAAEIPDFDEGTLAMLRAAFGQPALQIAG